MMIRISISTEKYVIFCLLATTLSHLTSCTAIRYKLYLLIGLLLFSVNLSCKDS